MVATIPPCQQVYRRSARATSRARSLFPYIIGALACVTAMTACSREPVSADLVKKATTLSAMSAINDATIEAAASAESSPPLEPRQFCAWVTARATVRSDSVKQVDGVFVDGWGHPLRLVIVSDGHLQLRSDGPDGICNNGGGDDICGPVIEIVPPRHPPLISP